MATLELASLAGKLDSADELLDETVSELDDETASLETEELELVEDSEEELACPDSCVAELELASPAD